MKDGKKYILIADDEKEIRDVPGVLLSGGIARARHCKRTVHMKIKRCNPGGYTFLRYAKNSGM
ncbi:MAG: hypothetical protein IJW21_06680 [Clostridia bacterium]|nr:hypothetical protein [Clostridia bacterium]